MSGEYRYLKFVLVGDHGVGKSAIAQRFAVDGFPGGGQYKPTVGVDFYKNTVFLPGEVTAEIEIWDIGADALYSRMTRNYLFGANVVFLCYDTTNYATFQNLEEWLRVLETASAFRLPRLALIGNKLDLAHLRTVKPEDHLQFAQDHSAEPYLFSAKTKEGFMQCFSQLAAECLNLELRRQDIDGANNVLKAMVIHPSNGAGPDMLRKVIPKELTSSQSDIGRKACIMM